MKNELTVVFGSNKNGNQVGVSVATTPTPIVLDIRNINNLSVTYEFTGAPTGSLQPEVSNDQINWYALGSAVAISAATSGRLPFTDVPEQYFQLAYTATSGSGTLFAMVNGKGF